MFSVPLLDADAPAVGFSNILSREGQITLIGRDAPSDATLIAARRPWQPTYPRSRSRRAGPLPRGAVTQWAVRLVLLRTGHGIGWLGSRLSLANHAAALTQSTAYRLSGKSFAESSRKVLTDPSLLKRFSEATIALRTLGSFSSRAASIR